MDHPEEACLGPDPLEELHLEVQLDHLGEVPEGPHDDAHAQFQTLHDQKPDPSREEVNPLLVGEEAAVHLHQSPYPPFPAEGEACPPLVVVEAVAHLHQSPFPPFLVEEAYPPLPEEVVEHR